MPIDISITGEGLLVQPIPSNTLKLSDVAPMPENLSAVPGAGATATRSDHQHPRLTSATTGHVLDVNGEATIVFTRLFTAKPAVTYMLDELADNGPVIIKVKSWTQDGNGNYTGCIVKGYRGQTLPASLTLLSALVSFNVFAGTTTGAAFTFIALQRSA
jgi:hypothetical protein